LRFEGLDRQSRRTPGRPQPTVYSTASKADNETSACRPSAQAYAAADDCGNNSSDGAANEAIEVDGLLKPMGSMIGRRRPRANGHPIRCLTIALAALALAASGAAPGRAQSATAQALSPELAKFADDCDVLRRGTIIKLEESLRGLRAGQVRTKDNARAIRQAESDLTALRARERVIVPALRFPVSVGEIGRLPSSGGHIEQILGPQKMLVRCSFRVQVVVTRNFRQIGEVVNQPVVFDVRGVPTAEQSEGGDAEFLQVFRIVGRETYRTADGRAASALVLEPLDMRPIEEYLKNKPGP
jgi:hypothetical protein